MVRSETSPASSNTLVTLITIGLVIAALYFGRAVLIPLALAVVVAFLLTPVVSRLENCHLGRIPSALLVLMVALAATGFLGWRATGELVEISRQLPGYKANIQKKLVSIRGHKDGNFNKAATTIEDLNKELTQAPAEPTEAPARRQANPKGSAKSPAAGSAENPLTVTVAEPPPTVVQQVSSLLGPLLGPLETAGIVIILALFMLVKRKDLRDRVIRLAGRDRLHNMTTALDDASRRLSRFLLVQLIVNASYGILFGLGLYFLDVPHALLFGVLGGLLRYIPYLGTMIGAAFPIAMAMAVFPGWTQVILVVALFLVLELSIANILEPVLYGAHTGVSALAILVAAVFWAGLWGPVGLILSTPLTLCMLVMGRHVLRLKFLEIALGDEQVLSPDTHLYQRLLAMDQEEVGDIAHAYLKEQQLGNLYDAVLIPALGFVEQDRHAGVLDEDKEKFVYNCIQELIEDLAEHTSTKSSSLDTTSPEVRLSNVSILCIPARDQSDELVASMLTQLLQRAGHRAQFLPIDAVDDMLKQVALQEAQIVCVSALPPFAVGHARSLCKRLHARYPDLKVVVGLWNYELGIAKAQERFESVHTDFVATSLVDVVKQIGQLTDAIILEEPAAAAPALIP